MQTKDESKGKLKMGFYKVHLIISEVNLRKLKIHNYCPQNM